MGLTSALFAGLTGMKTNEFRMDVIGNNIANVNTYAFKSSRANFQNQFLNTLSFGAAPDGAFGGTNPIQIGTGSAVGAVSRDFGGGTPETTGRKSDLAVQGQGLFILAKPDGSEVYTRDGSFQFNSENYLLSADGYFLQGYGVDNNFNINGSLGNLQIRLGEITTAQVTSEAAFGGDLNSEGNAAIADITTGEPYGNVRTVLSTANTQVFTDGAAGPLAAGTLMINLQNDNGVFVEAGNEIVLEDAIKGEKNLPSEVFDIEATTTLQNFMDWLEGVLGINTSSDLPDFTADGVPNPGVTINATADGIDIVGNIGNHNVLELGSSAFKIQKGTALTDPPGDTSPFAFSTADGFTQPDIESMRTSFYAYDSLGALLNIDVTLVLQSNDNSGNTWRYFAECSEDSDTDRVVGTGTVKFGTDGVFLATTGSTISINREGTGATTPQTIELDFSDIKGLAMGADSDSAIALISQDGFKTGTLQDYSIGPDGVITGSFTNGLARNLGQVVLATFRNYEGLVADSDNIYITGPDSGERIIKSPQELGAGTISAASLELSNVDLSREFINLIVSSTGFSASSRVIQTSDQLLSELMALTR
jgi:flagellar hook protein FlgE